MRERGSSKIPRKQFEIQVCFVYKIIAITLELWYKLLQTLLESGEFNHSESGEKRQFWSKEKSKHII